MVSGLPASAGSSAGCGKDSVGEPPTSIEVNGDVRDLITVVPSAYDSARPHSLVVAFHGRTNSSAQVRSYYRLEQGDASDTIFVYPSASRTAGGHFTWWQQGDPPDALRDFTLFDRLLETLSERYCIDRTRIFVVGHSLGATFANSVACARGDRVRAAATLGGGVIRSACRGRVAAMVLHNPKDDLVSIKEGQRARDTYLTQLGLGPPALAAEPRDFDCLRYGARDSIYPVLWCPHRKDYNGRGKYYPHTWPPDAGEVVMGFLRGLPDS